MTEQQTVKGHCNRCLGTRNQFLLYSGKFEWHETDDRTGEVLFTERESYELLKCCGCDQVTLRLTEDAPWYDESSVRYFPPAVSRQRPRWMVSFGYLMGSQTEHIRTLFNEVYSALQNGLPALAAMGVRALLEHVMVSTSGDQTSFAKNLAAFEAAGHVSPKQAARIKSILDVGHAAIHRSFVPDMADIHVLLDIAEHVVESVYIHDASVEKLEKSVPPRLNNARSGS